MDEPTRLAAESYLELLLPLSPRMKAMFGGYCVYVDEKVVALVCDGAIFVKCSATDAMLADWASLAPAYPGAKESWRLPSEALVAQPQQVLAATRAVAAALPARRPRKA